MIVPLVTALTSLYIICIVLHQCTHISSLYHLLWQVMQHVCAFHYGLPDITWFCSQYTCTQGCLLLMCACRTKHFSLTLLQVSSWNIWHALHFFSFLSPVYIKMFLNNVCYLLGVRSGSGCGSVTTLCFLVTFTYDTAMCCLAPKPPWLPNSIEHLYFHCITIFPFSYELLMRLAFLCL